MGAAAAGEVRALPERGGWRGRVTLGADREPVYHVAGGLLRGGAGSVLRRYLLRAELKRLQREYWRQLKPEGYPPVRRTVWRSASAWLGLRTRGAAYVASLLTEGTGMERSLREGGELRAAFEAWVTRPGQASEAALMEALAESVVQGPPASLAANFAALSELCRRLPLDGRRVGVLSGEAGEEQEVVLPGAMWGRGNGALARRLLEALKQLPFTEERREGVPARTRTLPGQAV